MRDFKLNSFQRVMFNVNKVFVLLCVVNLFLVIKFEMYGVGDDYYFAFLFPFIGAGVLAFSGAAKIFFVKEGSVFDMYIKRNYSGIWKKLHPWGDMSHNSFTSFAFGVGKYDDGSDEKLNRIKFDVKKSNWLLIWPFIILLSSWVLGILLLFIFQHLCFN